MRQAAAKAEEKRAAAAKAAQAERVRRRRLVEEQGVAECKARQEAAEEAARLAVAELTREYTAASGCRAPQAATR